MNTICWAGSPGTGADSAFGEQLVITTKVSTAPSDCHLGLDACLTIT
jgi:hypothetical protein